MSFVFVMALRDPMIPRKSVGFLSSDLRADISEVYAGPGHGHRGPMFPRTRTNNRECRADNRELKIESRGLLLYVYIYVFIFIYVYVVLAKRLPVLKF